MGGPSSPGNPISKRKGERKQTAAWWACVAWIVSGIYLFATTAAASFFSIRALLFFFVGTFAATMVIGSAASLVERSMIRLLTTMIRSPGLKAAAFASAIRQLLLVAEVAAAYLAAQLAFNTMA